MRDPLSTDSVQKLFPRIHAKPPSPIPLSSIAKVTTAPSREKEPISSPASPKASPVISQTFVIEIDPGNPPYPQREPDPLADIQVFDGAGKLVLQKMSFPMNTVYYTRNKEIRVTFDPELRGIITSLSSAALSVMVMTKNLNTPSDYIINIYTPGSQEFRDYLAVCNQVLNSGGRKQPRRMGWL